MSVYTRIVLFIFSLFIVGCNSVPNKTKPVLDVSPKKPKIENKKIDQIPIPKSKFVTYKYGNFEVRVNEDGSQSVIGGRYMPAKAPSIASNYYHLILINYSDKTLELFRLGYFGYEPVIGYAVVTPRAKDLPKDVVRGVVTKIDTNPVWCPTENIRRKQKHLPSGCLPPGHKYNAMGSAKFEIKWSISGWELHRIHGTEGYPLGDFWNEQTFGCTRLLNSAIDNLVDLLGPNAVKDGIEVIAYR